MSGIYSFVTNNYVELQVLDWCKELLGYPLEAGAACSTSGVLRPNLIALAVARNAGPGSTCAREGLAARAAGALTVYCSAEAHSSLTKAVELLGMGTRRRCAACPPTTSCASTSGRLAEMVARDRADGLPPVCVVGAAGHHQHRLDRRPAGPRRLLRREGLWFHVDGAFGAWAAIAPGVAPLVRRHGARRLARLRPAQVDEPDLPRRLRAGPRRGGPPRTFSLHAVVPGARGGGARPDGVDVPWLSDYGFELSRGFHALKVWMALKEHGAEKFARVIQQNIDQARYLAGWSRPRPSSSRRCRPAS